MQRRDCDHNDNDDDVDGIKKVLVVQQPCMVDCMYETSRADDPGLNVGR